MNKVQPDRLTLTVKLFDDGSLLVQPPEEDKATGFNCVTYRGDSLTSYPGSHPLSVAVGIAIRNSRNVQAAVDESFKRINDPDEKRVIKEELSS